MEHAHATQDIKEHCAAAPVASELPRGNYHHSTPQGHSLSVPSISALRYLVKRDLTNIWYVSFSRNVSRKTLILTPYQILLRCLCFEDTKVSIINFDVPSQGFLRSRLWPEVYLSQRS